MGMVDDWESRGKQYHLELEWENRDRREIQESEIIPKCALRPEVRIFSLFFRELFLLIFFFLRS